VEVEVEVERGSVYVYSILLLSPSSSAGPGYTLPRHAYARTGDVEAGGARPTPTSAGAGVLMVPSLLISL
jgi:hypothetical protein